jgi:hypothetical protein
VQRDSCHEEKEGVTHSFTWCSWLLLVCLNLRFDELFDFGFYCCKDVSEGRNAVEIGIADSLDELLLVLHT